MWCVEPTDELLVSNAQTDRTAAAADADEKSFSPIHRYVSYDERPLPAIRRFLLAVTEVVLYCCCTSGFTAIQYLLAVMCLIWLIFSVYFFMIFLINVTESVVYIAVTVAFCILTIHVFYELCILITG